MVMVFASNSMVGWKRQSWDVVFIVSWVASFVVGSVGSSMRTNERSYWRLVAVIVTQGTSTGKRDFTG